MARFNMHSSACAILSDLLAQRLNVEYAEGAFVAGLLHDVGRLLIAMALPRENALILDGGRGAQRWPKWRRPILSIIEGCEQEVLGFTHAELSAEALKYWKLPEEIQIAVRDHHSSPAESIAG